jgi:sodium/bile acid cotransporter 7
LSDSKFNWRKLRPDGFLMAIIASAVLATLLPVRGQGVTVMTWTSKIMLGVLFFVYGVRLKRDEAIAGLKHWRLHTVILSCTYVVFPLVGLALGVLSPSVINPELYRGLLWICIVPGTVQSAINFTSIARGNVAGAIVASSISNLLGVFLTPLLAMAVMSTTGLHISPKSILDISLQVLFPFILGQLVRKWLAPFVLAHPKLKYFDHLTIILVVYLAFSSGIREGVWSRLGLGEIAVILGISLAMLAAMLVFTWNLAGWLRFNRRDQIAIQFNGTKKSLTTGVPMAIVLFPAAAASAIVLPLMVFHQAQLMACSVLAGRYAAKDEAWHEVGEEPLQLADEGGGAAGHGDLVV